MAIAEDMKQNVKYVSNSNPGKDSVHEGAIFVAPFGTTVPTDANSPLDAAFKCLGYVTDDGISEPNAYDAGDDTNAYGGDKVFTGDPTYSFSLSGAFLEVRNLTLLKTLYNEENVGSNTKGDIVIHKRSITPKHRVFVYEERLTGGYRQRNVVGDGTMVISDDITHATTDPMSISWTLNGYPDANGDSSVAYQQTKTDEEQAAAGGGGGSRSVDDGKSETPANLTVPEV